MTDQELNEAVARKLGFTLVKDYCHSIEAAFEIVKHVGDHSSWSMYWLGGPDEKKFWRIAIIGSEYVDSDTAPMAICLAFLKLP